MRRWCDRVSYIVIEHRTQMSIDDARVGLKACMWNGEEVYFKCKMSTRLEKLLLALCNRQGLSLDAISACFDG